MRSLGTEIPIMAIDKYANRKYRIKRYEKKIQ